MKLKTPDEMREAAQRFKEGETTGFNDIYRLSYKYLFVCVMHIVHDEETAQDMLQETYMEISRNIQQLKSADDFLGWASTIANRKCFAYLKKKTDLLLPEDEDESQTGFFEEIADNEAFIPETILQDREKQRLIKDIIDNLPEMQRLCIIAYYYNEEKQEEIAQELGIPVNTVKSHLNRAKTRIKDEVIELDEKKGTRLYSLAPFMLLLFAKEVDACEIGIPQNPELLSSKEIKGRSKGAKMTVKSKVVIGLASTIIGAAALVTIIINGISSDSEKVEESIQQVEEKVTESEDVQQPIQEKVEEAASIETTAIQTTTIQEEQPMEEEGLLVELMTLDASESFAMSKGGVIPLTQNGLWGAINFAQEQVVPFEYSGIYRAPDEYGNFVLMNETDTDTVYYLFDAKGNLICQGTDEISSSGGMYFVIKRQGDSEIGAVEYYKMDGTPVLQVPCEVTALKGNGFYNGVATVYSAQQDITGEAPQIGSLSTNGQITWRTDETYEALSEEERQNGVYIPMSPMNTANNGYYITNNPYLEGGYIKIYTQQGELFGDFNLVNCIPDSERGIVYSTNNYNEEIQWRSFYHDGSYFYHYGSKMVLIVGNKNVLIDFSLYPGISAENADNRIVTAVFDTIIMSDFRYWLIQSGNQWGYIDHSGKEIAQYQDASGFENGYALMKDNGTVYLINEELEPIQELGEADSIFVNADLFCLRQGDKLVLYCMRSLIS